MKSNLITWKSLKTRITLITLVVFVVGIWSLLFYLSRVLQKDLQNELGEQQFSIVSILASEINHEVVLRFSSLEKIAEQITPAILNNTSELQTLLEDRPILDILFNGGYFVAQTDGTTVADFPVSTGRIGTNFSDRGWMIDALNGKATIGKPIVGKKRPVPVFTIASPIRDSGGKVIGVLAGITDLNKPNFLDRVVDNKYGKKGGFLLAAPQHNLFVTATDKKRIMQQMPAPGVNPLFDKYNAGFEGFGRGVNSFGVEELTASKKVPDAGWFLIVKTPITEAFAMFYDTQQHFIIATIILTLLVGCVIWWVLKHHLSPIFSTVNTLTLMSEGSQPADLLPVVRQDELGLLISGFNALLKSKEDQEVSLKLSEQKFRKAIEEAPFPIMIYAEDGEVLALSRTWTELSGYALADIPTIAIWTGKAYGIHKKPVIEEINTLYNLKHRKTEGEYTVNCHDGTKRIWDFSSVSISFLSDGRRTAMSMASDVTERKKSEEELHQTKAILQAAMDHSPAGIAIADAPDGKLRYVNDAWLLISGGDRQSAINGVGFEEYVANWKMLNLDGSPLQNDEVPLARAIMFGETSSREFIIRRTVGDDHIVLANAAPIKDGSGNISAGIVVFTDITDHMLAELELEENRKQYRNLVEGTPDLITRVDTEGRIIFVNHTALKIFGLPPEECVGRLAFDFGHPDDRASTEAAFNTWLQSSEEVFTHENRLVGIYGQSHFHMVWSIRAERDESGMVTGFASTARDVTDIRHTQEDKAKLESQLHQAQKMESIGSLAGGVAHDFNNKLTVIHGYTQLAQMVAGPESEIHHYLQEICKAAESSAGLTRQLLAFARKQTIAPQKLDLNETITGMLTMLNRLIGENINLDWQTKSDLWPINFDPSQVDQILANLCINAKDSIKDNGKIIIETGNCTIDESYVNLHPYAVAGDYVKITVSDNGCGMDKETVDHIFEPFFTTKEAGKGTGLGLATVFGIVKQNNGFINVYSESGIGTTFSIYLPRYIVNSEQIQPKVPNISAPRGQETILLVEDDLAILNMATMILTIQGYAVLPANSATEALHLAQEHAGGINLLITDVIMPEMNGKVLTHTLLARNPELKSIFMSGYTADAISHHGVLDEGVNFIQKPFSLPDLAHKVRDVLDSI